MMNMSLYSLKMEDECNVFDHINKFNELVFRLMNARHNIKDEEQMLILLASLPKSFFSLPKSYIPLLQSMLAGKSTVQLDEAARSLKESQQMMVVHKSSEENQILVTNDWQGNNYGDQYGWRFQQKDMTNVKFHCCEEFDHMQVKCLKFMEGL